MLIFFFYHFVLICKLLKINLDSLLKYNSVFG